MTSFFRRLFGCRPKKNAGPQNFQAMLDGYRGTALIYMAAKLKLPDLLADGPRNSEELAKILNAHAPTLRRFLRGLVALGICGQTEDGYFDLTPTGMKLQSGNNAGSKFNHAILNGEEYMPAWNDLLHSVFTGETAFDHAFGMSPWEHRQKNVELNRCFNDLLAQSTAGTVRAILAACDFSPYPLIADIGGGQGVLLAEILKAHPSVRGILFDQAHVIAAGNVLQTAGVSERCRIMEGNFFEKIPGGANAIVLKSILHDWNDEKCLTILKNCHAALQCGATLFLVEKIMPEQVMENPAIILSDLHMLAVTGGKERTADEFEKLLAASGFKLEKIISTRGEHRILKASRI